jgi:CTD small phosphatase-like protein 2
MLETIEQLSRDFELILFTDGLRELHTKIIDKIDPQEKFFPFRLFREHCYESSKGFFVKDLRIINRQPEDIILVDNSTCAFGFQLNNGVPIIPFTGDKTDVELLLLSEYLRQLLQVPDVRKANKDHFKFQQYVGAETVQAVYNKIFKKDD